MVPPSAFIFSGIVRIMKNSLYEFWNFEIFVTRWLWLCLFTFRFWLILGMLQGGFLWFLSMRSTNYIQLCREKNKPRWGFPFWGFIYDFVIFNKKIVNFGKSEFGKMEFFICLTIPENMNALGGTIKTQWWAIVSFEKIR